MDQKQNDLHEDLDALAANIRVDDGVLIRVLEALAPVWTNDYEKARQTVRRWLRDQARPLEQEIPVSMYTNEFTGETWFE